MRISSLAPGEFSSYHVIRFIFICLSRLPGVRLRVSHGNAPRVSVARTASFVGADPFREPFDTQHVHAYTRIAKTKRIRWIFAARPPRELVPRLVARAFPRFSFSFLSIAPRKKETEKKHRSFGRVFLSLSPGLIRGVRRFARVCRCESILSHAEYIEANNDNLL